MCIAVEQVAKPQEALDTVLLAKVNSKQTVWTEKTNKNGIKKKKKSCN